MAVLGPVHSPTTVELVSLPELMAAVSRVPQRCGENGPELLKVLRRSMEPSVLAPLERQVAKEPREQALERPERGDFQLRRGAALRVEIVP